jgi:hypothetical protein
MAYTAASPHGCAGLHGNLFAEMRDGFDRHRRRIHGVQTGPGATALALITFPAKSWASLR